MEMASGCPRQMPASKEYAPEFPHKPIRGPHGGWQQNEIDALRARVTQAETQGESLRSVFDEMGLRLGRKPNSIRNFYYAQLRTQQGDQAQRALPFETFTQEEIEQLIKSVLTARAQGMSVRACVRQLSGGDHTRMLRYQNKYRSIVRSRPALVQKIMKELREAGVAFVSPYPASEDDAAEQMDRIRTRAESCGDAQVAELFSALEHLLHLAFDRPQAPAPADTTPFEEHPAVRQADRLKAQLDVTRIALDDERRRSNRLRSEAEGMVTILKEFIALPEASRTDSCTVFCHQAAARLSAVECALMED